MSAVVQKIHLKFVSKQQISDIHPPLTCELQIFQIQKTIGYCHFRIGFVVGDNPTKLKTMVGLLIICLEHLDKQPIVFKPSCRIRCQTTHGIVQL